MERLKRDVILIRLMEALQEKGSWCGETHVQKATYFLQELTGTHTAFDFMIYKHGPFSFDLREELVAMQADGLISLKMRDPNYGPSIVPEERAQRLCDRFPRTLAGHEARIDFVATKFSNRGVTELERLATSYFVSKEIGFDKDARSRATKVNELKPHVSMEDARKAIAETDKWRKEAIGERQPDSI